MKILRVYGIAGCGKGEVDHLGGMSKVAVRQEVESSTKLDSSNNENTDETVANKLIVPGTVVALAADSSPIDIVCFVKVVKVCLSQEHEKDYYGHIIRTGHEHIRGHFSEKISTSTGHHFKLSKMLLSSTKKVLFIPLYNSPKQEHEKDYYGHIIRTGHEHIRGHFSEKISTSTGHHFKLSKMLLSSTKKVLFIPLYNSPKQGKDFRYQTLILSRSCSM